MSERSQEWPAFLIDWIVSSIVWFVGVLITAALLYGLLPSGVAFVLLSAFGLGTTVWLINWLFFSRRTAPPSLGRRVLPGAKPISAWNAIRGR